jgi:hypothetical protein
MSGSAPEEDDRARMIAAIAEASEEVGLDTWYRACVEPLMSLSPSGYPRCCGSGCEPCSETLIEVAVRAKRRLAID